MKNFHHTENCPIRDILSRLSSKWAMLILITLDANEVMRFNDLQKSIGDISQRMLSVTLRTLEADGLIFTIKSFKNKLTRRTPGQAFNDRRKILCGDIQLIGIERY